MSKKTILVIDDNATNLSLFVKLLDQYDVIEAINGFDALEIVKQESLDLILLDIMMPQINGYDVCQIIKSREKNNNIPIIFITAKTEEMAVEKAYDVGGIDFIRKPIKPKELLAKVKIHLQLQTLITDLEASQEELKLLIATDPLTDLYNKKYFTETAEYLFQLAKREQSDLSMLMLDIDDFKAINDYYGHKAGDDVIIELAATLKKLVRKSDIICRFSGEEFLILLPKTQRDGAMILAQKIKKATEIMIVNSIDDLSEEPQAIHFTISLGISEINDQQDDTLDSLMYRANQALLDAKRASNTS